MDPGLASVLGAFGGGVRPLGEPEPLGNAGGLSGSRLWRFDSDLGPLAARAWPDAVTPTRLSRVHGWLARAAPLGFVPVPVPTSDGQTFVAGAGRLWEVTRWLPGAPDRSASPPPERVRAAFGALAAFHKTLATPASLGPSPGLRARLGEVEAFLHGEFAAIDARLARETGDPETSTARQWLTLAREVAPGVRSELARVADLPVPLQPCLRDARPDHVLFDGDRVRGLVDFGAMDVENVAADFARLAQEWFGDDPARLAEARAAYEEVRGVPGPEAGLVGAFQRSAALLIGAHWVRWHFQERRAFADPAAVRDGLARGLARVEWLVRSPRPQGDSVSSR